MTTWHKGPPPYIGWWIASRSGNPTLLRWWNGEWWSRPLDADASMHDVERFALIMADLYEDIRWADRPAHWPAPHGSL